MIGALRVLAIIPARGGSKGVPRKNIRDVAGQPLIGWTLTAAKQSRYLDRVIVSSEDAVVIGVARELGADVPFVRPAELARDDTPGIDPVLHALREVPGYDLVVLLQPTSPLRTAEDIDQAISLLVSQDAASCVTVVEATNHPYWTYQVAPSGRLKPFIELSPDTGSRRQDLPKALALNGAVYVARVARLLEARSFLGPDTVCLEMPAARSVDVDTFADIDLAEQYLKRDSGSHHPGS